MSSTFCFFQAVVLEGNYWKRRIEVVMKEYNKWRIYYKKRLRKHHQDGKPFQEKKVAPSWRSSEMFAGCSRIEEVRGKEDDMLFFLDFYLNDTSDTLFTTTHGQPSSYHYSDFGMCHFCHRVLLTLLGYYLHILNKLLSGQCLLYYFLFV
ncbi:hypothetical protein AB205_0157180 [Aquarana catesbeiana]|uniref:Uncharacterized protein n=1 Tax=Aquarana catesbeiana TaxID=8400 RepID=A0A2G9SA79_AQUCT|nr:hypothetical protein AB205_0157180 [Aquarana catesbeiana]